MKGEIDFLLLAGDIDTRGHQHDYADLCSSYLDVLVICIAGNHEFYGTDIDDALDQARVFEGAANPRNQSRRAHCLENSCHILKGLGVRILGTKLWTDYQLFGGERQQEAMRA